MKKKKNIFKLLIFKLIIWMKTFKRSFKWGMTSKRTSHALSMILKKISSKNVFMNTEESLLCSSTVLRKSKKTWDSWLLMTNKCSQIKLLNFKMLWRIFGIKTLHQTIIQKMFNKTKEISWTSEITKTKEGN